MRNFVNNRKIFGRVEWGLLERLLCLIKITPKNRKTSLNPDVIRNSKVGLQVKKNCVLPYLNCKKYRLYTIYRDNIMKGTKAKWIAVALTSLMLALGAVIAGGVEKGPAVLEPVSIKLNLPNVAIENSPVLEERWIIAGGYSTDRGRLKSVGCEVAHELSDSLAVKCPKGVSVTGAIEDRIVYAMDMGANIQTGSDRVWNDLGYDGSGIVVAVLDTGVDYNHPELKNDIIGGKSFIIRVKDYRDDNGHGTHCAGIITSNGAVQDYSRGAAPGTKIWAGKVLDRNGRGYTSDIAAAIEYVVKNEIAEIISLSLGGGGYTTENCDGDYLAEKVNWAVSRGVTVVAAAGNTDGVISSPGCASGAIAVGAVDKNDVRAGWSGTGPALDIMAPGVGIYSTIPNSGYAYYSGTSMATPHVAAVVAMMMQANAETTDSEIKDALYSTAVDLGAFGYDNYYGQGRVDAYGAVKKLITSATCESDYNCDDGLYCNGAETCQSGICVAGAPVDCSVTQGADECNIGVCDENAKACATEPKPDQTACGDNGICCSGICSEPFCRTDSDCNDGDDSTKDTCINGGTCNAYCQNDSVSEEPSECAPNGRFCNCDGKCNARETKDTCPWDCI
jgi:hypothetical protein